MTDNEIKESLSECFIKMVLAQNRFKIYKSEYDHGIDLLVCPVIKKEHLNGDITYQDSDRPIGIQLKCTTENYAKERDGSIHYNLRHKNFIELKEKVDSSYIKLVLILFILPEKQSTWMNIIEDQMLLKKRCFWYIPDDSNITSEIRLKDKDSHIKIFIPNSNHLLADFQQVYNTINKI